MLKAAWGTYWRAVTRAAESPEIFLKFLKRTVYCLFLKVYPSKVHRTQAHQRGSLVIHLTVISFVDGNEFGNRPASYYEFRTEILYTPSSCFLSRGVWGRCGPRYGRSRTRFMRLSTSVKKNITSSNHFMLFTGGGSEEEEGMCDEVHVSPESMRSPARNRWNTASDRCWECPVPKLTAEEWEVPSTSKMLASVFCTMQKWRTVISFSFL